MNTTPATIATVIPWFVDAATEHVSLTKHGIDNNCASQYFVEGSICAGLAQSIEMEFGKLPADLDEIARTVYRSTVKRLADEMGVDYVDRFISGHNPWTD